MLKIILAAKWASVKAQLQYPVDFIVHVLGISLIGIVEILVLLLLTNKFTNIGGWDFWEIGFMISLWRLSHSIHHLLFIPFWWQSRMVKSGEFDRLLVRPVHPILQIMTQGHPLPAVGEFIPAIGLFLITFTYVSISWNVISIAILLLFVLSGAIIEWSVFLFLSAFDFYFVETRRLKEIPSVFLFEATKYPIHIFGKFFPLILTYILPYAFIAYYPTHYFFNETLEISNKLLPFLSPIVAIISFFVAFIFWSIGLNHYKSSGT